MAFGKRGQLFFHLKILSFCLLKKMKKKIKIMLTQHFDGPGDIVNGPR
jgi:hypothetical protein